MPENLIKIENISLAFEKKKILENISFEINKQDFTTIIGPNGAGKTTLLKIILGNLKASSGKIEKDKNLKIGYVPQKFWVDQSIPISVEYFLKLYKKFDTGLWNKILEQTSISENLLKKQLYNLSGGETQKILLANALLQKPNLLILDEPAQNLDITNQLEFYNLLNKIYAQGNISILMISHDLHMVMSSTKQVICLQQHICCSGEPHMVTQNPEFISIFGKDMSELMSVYNHYHNHKH